ncbi:MAG TPA: DUF86 domain-containing protein [Candidatus Paceibacterota bacterium]
MSERGAKLYLADIENALAKIEQYTSGLSFEQFAANQLVIDAVVRNFEIVGEAVRNIPSEVTATHPDIPWEKMIGMRNKVIHEYFGVDEEILWKTIQEDLPMFREQIAKILKKI